MSIELRNFRVGDEPALFEVFYTAIHQVCCRDYSEEQIEAWAPRTLDTTLWNKRVRGINPIVATIDDKIVGYTDLQEDGLIDHFFVHGDFQGRGIAHSLMSEVLKRGASKKALYSDVSLTAQPFYEKYGFKVVKEQTVEIRGVKLGNSVMERHLT